MTWFFLIKEYDIMAEELCSFGSIRTSTLMTKQLYLDPTWYWNSDYLEKFWAQQHSYFINYPGNRPVELGERTMNIDSSLFSCDSKVVYGMEFIPEWWTALMSLSKQILRIQSMNIAFWSHTLNGCLIHITEFWLWCLVCHTIDWLQNHKRFSSRVTLLVDSILLSFCDVTEH